MGNNRNRKAALFPGFLASRKLAVTLLVLLMLLSVLGTIVPQEAASTECDMEKWRTEHPLLSGLAARLGLDNLYTGHAYLSLLVTLVLSITVCTFKRAGAVLRNGGGRAACARWGSLVFHMSFIVIFAGGAVSAWSRFEGVMVLTEGQRFSGSAEEYSAIKRNPLPSPPRTGFAVALERLSPPEGETTTYKSEVIIEYGGRETRGTVRDFHALSHGGFTFHQKDHGFSPSFVLKDLAGRVVFDAYVALRSHHGPGEDVKYEDAFAIPGTGLEVEGRLYPDMAVVNGRMATKSPRPENPVISLKVKERGREIYRGSVRQGEEVRFGGYYLSFNGLRHWSSFRVVRDRGVPVVYAGFGMCILGFLTRLLFMRPALYGAEAEEAGERYMSEGAWQRAS